jgi:hypothetical protein
MDRAIPRSLPSQTPSMRLFLRTNKMTNEPQIVLPPSLNAPVSSAVGDHDEQPRSGSLGLASGSRLRVNCGWTRKSVKCEAPALWETKITGDDQWTPACANHYNAARSQRWCARILTASRKREILSANSASEPRLKAVGSDGSAITSRTSRSRK